MSNYFAYLFDYQANKFNEICYIMEIGEKILSILEKKGMSQAELGRRIDRSAPNVRNIFKRTSIDSDLLKKIGEALEYDFLSEVAQHSNRLEEPNNEYKKTIKTYNQAYVDVLLDNIMFLKSEILNYQNRENEFLQDKNDWKKLYLDITKKQK